MTATLVACGNSDTTSSTSEGEKACQDLQAKAAQCGLMLAGACNTNAPCAAECQAQASCDELKSGTPSDSLVRCIAMCEGAGPDDFICKDGKAYVKKAGVCDGHYQCDDGSDEANCGGADGGAG